MMNRSTYGQRPTVPYPTAGRGQGGFSRGRACGCRQTAQTGMTRGGCGCEGHGRDDLLARIQHVDFALYETILYLDVYPHSCEALEAYHKLRCESEALHAEYESTHGPLTAFGNRSKTAWNWMDNPLPWAYDAE